MFPVLLVSDTVRHDLEIQGCSTSWWMPDTTQCRNYLHLTCISKRRWSRSWFIKSPSNGNRSVDSHTDPASSSLTSNFYTVSSLSLWIIILKNYISSADAESLRSQQIQRACWLFYIQIHQRRRRQLVYATFTGQRHLEQRLWVGACCLQTSKLW